MLFSDNVSIETELELKQFARDKGLLVMGPDCGTAIINGAPLAFANVCNRGNIGLVAASGTGAQEVTSLISNEGAGISQAIGTGGRDVKAAIGGIMFIEGIKALADDPDTNIIVLVSKPPYIDVQKKIADVIKGIKKPVVAILLGGDPKIVEDAGAIAANTLEEAALIASALSKGVPKAKAKDAVKKNLATRLDKIDKIALEESKGKARSQKYIRGLFSGGTFCEEAQLILKDKIGFCFSNAPLSPDFKLADSLVSQKHTIIDLGEDEFTVGRPHPMIDFSLRKKRIIQEAQDPETAVILLDIVLGWGSNMTPAEEITPEIVEALKMSKVASRPITFVSSITGTDGDPQNRTKVHKLLEDAGAIVMPSNAAAAQLAGQIVKKIREE